MDRGLQIRPAVRARVALTRLSLDPAIHPRQRGEIQCRAGTRVTERSRFKPNITKIQGTLCLPVAVVPSSTAQSHPM